MPKSWNPDKETGKITYGLMKHVDRFWIYVAIAVVSLVLAWLLVTLFHNDRPIFYKLGRGGHRRVSLIYSWYFPGSG